MSLYARLSIPIVIGLLFAQLAYNVYLTIGKPYFPVFSQSSPRFVQVSEGFNIVDYKGMFFAIPFGDKVDWQLEDFATAHNLISSTTLSGLIETLNPAKASNIADEHLGFSIYSVSDFYVARPKTMAKPIIGSQEQQSLKNRAITATSLAEIKDSIELYLNGSFDFDVATTIYTEENLQIVGLGNHLYVVPIGATVDFAVRSGVSNPYAKFGSLNEARQQLSHLRKGDWYNPIALKIDEFKFHNILNFAGKYFAIPLGVEVNLAEYDGNLPFWIKSSENLGTLKDTLAAREFDFFFPNPTQIKKHNLLNIIAYQSDYFALPIGTDFDFVQPLHSYPNWVVRAESYEDLMALIKSPAFVPFFPNPTQIKKHNLLNIIAYQSDYFALPIGTDFDFVQPLHSYPNWVVRAESYEDLMALIKSPAFVPFFPVAVLLDTEVPYNIIGAGDKFFAVPFGVDFDDRLKATSLTGSSMEAVLDKIVEMKETGYQLPMPVLLKSLSSSNIVGYKDKIYLIPHGLPFDFDEITTPLPSGVLSASSEDELYRLIERIAVDGG